MSTTIAPTTANHLFVAFRGRTKLRRIATVNEASAIMRAARERTGLGASRLPPLLIYGPDGTQIGHVSYNGRVWQEAPDAADRLVYDPTDNPFGRERQIDGGAVFERPALIQ
jgi:hypothetical protein